MSAGQFGMNATRTNRAAPDAMDAAAPDPKALAAIGRALEAHYAELTQAPLLRAFTTEDAVRGDAVHRGSR